VSQDVPRRRWLERCLSLALLAFVFAAVYFPLNDTDIWWHLASGRWIWEHRALPRTDPFAASTLTRPWADLHWLFQVIAFLAYRLGGAWAVVLLKSAVVTAGASVLLRAVDCAVVPPLGHPSYDSGAELGGGARVGARAMASLCLAPVIFLARNLIFARPIAFTLLLLALFLWILERQVARGRTRALWLLPLLQMIWCNLQPVSPLGPVLVGSYLAGETITYLGQRRGLFGLQTRQTSGDLVRGGAVLAGVLAAFLVTPYGAAAWEVPLELFSRISPRTELFSLNVSENVPTWVVERTEPQSIAWFKWVAAAAFASLTIARGPGRLSRLLALAALILPAWMAHRNALVFAWVAAPVVAIRWSQTLSLGSAEGMRRRASWALAASACAASALLLLAGALWQARRGEGDPRQPAPFWAPVQATRALAQSGVPGPVFTSVRFGSYVIWALPAANRPLIDGRLVLRRPEELEEHLDVLDHPERFERLRSREGFAAAMLPIAHPDRYRKLLASLARDPRWALTFTDGWQALFLFDPDRRRARLDLDQEATVAQIRASHLAENPAVRLQAELYLATMLAETGHRGRAIELLRSIAGPDAQALLGRCLLLDDDLDAAEAVAKALLDDGARPEGSWNLLALVALARGDERAALDWIERTLLRAPHDEEARAILGRLGGRAEDQQ
jgi:hypothetical protein